MGENLGLLPGPEVLVLVKAPLNARAPLDSSSVHKQPGLRCKVSS